MKDFLQAGLYFLVFVCVLLIHFILSDIWLPSPTNFSSVYIFTASVCFVALLSVAVFNKIQHKQLGFIFLILISLKFFLAVVFWNQTPQVERNQIKISFMILYLISLVLITIFAATRLLNPEK